MPDSTIARSSAITEIIAEKLREEISLSRLAPGASLKQDEIAARFSVSPTPVREALKLLVAEGLATLHHNRGCYVADLSSNVARELMEFRATLEPRLAVWALDRISDREIEQARTIITKIDKTTSPTQRLRLAAEFHTVIYSLAHRPFFLEQVNRARNNLNRYWILAWKDGGFHDNTQDEHREILKLCAAKDAPRLGSLIERHIIASGEVVLRYLQKLETENQLSAAI